MKKKETLLDSFTVEDVPYLKRAIAHFKLIAEQEASIIRTREASVAIQKEQFQAIKNPPPKPERYQFTYDKSGNKVGYLGWEPYVDPIAEMQKTIDAAKAEAERPTREATDMLTRAGRETARIPAYRVPIGDKK